MLEHVNLDRIGVVALVAAGCGGRFDFPSHEAFGVNQSSLKWQQSRYCFNAAKDTWKAARRYYALDVSLGLGAAISGGAGAVLLSGSTIYCEGDCHSKIAGVMFTAAAAALLGVREVGDWGAAAALRAEAAESIRYYGVMNLDGYTWEGETGFDLCTEVLEQVAKDFVPSPRKPRDPPDAGNPDADEPDAGNPDANTTDTLDAGTASGG